MFSFLASDYALSHHWFCSFWVYGTSILLALVMLPRLHLFPFCRICFRSICLWKLRGRAVQPGHIGAILFRPAMGGFMYAWTDAPSSGVAKFCAFTRSIVFSSQRLKPKPAYSSDSQNKQSMFKRIGEGLKYVFQHKIILSAMTLDLFAVLFGGATALYLLSLVRFFMWEQ